MGGGRTYCISPAASMSRSSALSARRSRVFRASAKGIFQSAAAFSAVKGLIGRRETRAASLSEKRMLRIFRRSADGVTPWGKRFNRSVNSAYPDFNVWCAILLLTEGPIHRSSAAENGNATAQGNVPGETDRDLFAFHNHGYLHLAVGKVQHSLQFFRVFIYIDIAIPLAIGFPRLVAEGSGVCSVDDDFVRHDLVPPISKKLFHCATHLPPPHRNGTAVGRCPFSS